MDERERRLDIAARAPQTLVEPLEEIEARDKMNQLYRQSRNARTVTDYEAGWKAAKAYHDVNG